MDARILPRDEWWRLDGLELGTIAPNMPGGTAVLVVEDDGQIVGHLALVPLWHAEAIWIAPGRRRRAGVFRRLLRALGAAARGLNAPRVIPGSMGPEMDRILERLGAEPLPGRCFSFAATESKACQSL